jgi:hypothetical protein
VDELTRHVPGSLTALRLGLVGFVLAWILGPDELRSAFPIWVPFLVALGLEVSFLVGAFRPDRRPRPDRAPQGVDREHFGYEGQSDELLLVEDENEELWIPYSGETDEELEELIAEARAGGPEAAEAVEAESGGPSLGDRLRRFAVGVGVIAGLGLAVWFVESRTGWGSLSGDTRLEAVERFSAEASLIAGKSVSIRCDESRDYVGAVQHADGVAIVGGDRAYLTPERCYDLYRVAFEDEITSSRTGRAIAVLAHEAWHLRGVGEEGRTECFALQSGVDLGVRLGLSEGRARQLMRQQLVENQLRGAATVEYVVPAECRDGGSLDLNAADAAFP